jgi:hypothetical protein
LMCQLETYGYYALSELSNDEKNTREWKATCQLK